MTNRVLLKTSTSAKYTRWSPIFCVFIRHKIKKHKDCEIHSGTIFKHVRKIRQTVNKLLCDKITHAELYSMHLVCPNLYSMQCDARGRECACARVALLIQYASRRRHVVCGLSGFIFFDIIS
jgi:hypothetical protein